VAILAGAAFADGCLQAEAQPGFRVDADLVLVPVTVTDPRGASVTGLGKEDFRVLDNRREQTIAAFYSNDAPCSVALVLDVSGSMRNSLNREKAAARAFLEVANPEDDFSLVTVSSAPGLRSGRLGDPIGIEDRVRAQSAGGATALVDSIYLAVDGVRRVPGKRRALLVISDGMDNHSRYTRTELFGLAVESDVQIYSIALEDAQPNQKPIELSEAERGVAFLRELSERTGGVCLRVRDYEDVSAAAQKISAAMRNQYVIGYRAPDPDKAESWHSIQVKVGRPRISVYARSGYRAP
jgi:Ca-activated chloride channel family protein